jgi:uncharacterized protein (TIGR00251 family)
MPESDSCDIASHVKGGLLRIIAKPGKKKTRVAGYESVNDALIVEVAAPAEDNKANIALVKFLSRQLKRPVAMKSGFSGKEKVFLIG